MAMPSGIEPALSKSTLLAGVALRPVDELEGLLRQAAAADGMTRINYRDRIAALGVPAIERLEPWLRDERLGAFAVQTILRAALGPGAAVAARSALLRGRVACSESVRCDIDATLARLGSTRAATGGKLPQLLQASIGPSPQRSMSGAPAAVRQIVERWVAQGRPPQPAEPWDRNDWLAWLPEYSDLFRALPRALDRAALRHACADATVDEASATRALIPVTIWGYVNANYGPSRTATMLRTSHAGHRLLAAAQTLEKQGALAAYVRLSDGGGSHLDGLGPAFATKFMYFCQPVGQAPIALILDSLASKWLANNVGISVPSDRWSRPVYAEYLRLMHAWASELGCAADDIECCIFRDSAAVEGNRWGR
jgi:hypothetical protein